MHSVRLAVTKEGLRLTTSRQARRNGTVAVAQVSGAVCATVGRIFSCALPGPQPSGPAAFVNWALQSRGREPLPNGDFAALLVTEREAILARDAQGRYPLYYRRDARGRVLVASTCLTELASDGDLDPTYFCSYLAAAEVSQQHVRRTPFANVERVLPGEALVVAPNGSVKSTSTTSRSALLDSEVRAEPETLRAVLQRAVVDRMADVTGCHLSGGLDSSSLALLVALHLASHSDDRGELVLVSATYAEGELAGERQYIADAVDRVKQILPTARSVLLPADDVLDFDDFETIAASTDEPYAQAFRAPLMAGLAAVAASEGCNSLLTGCGADPVVDVDVFSPLTLVRHGRLGAAAREARRLAEMQERSVRTVVTESLVRPLAPLVLEKVARRGIPRTSIRSLGRFVRPPWLTREFAARHRYDAAAREEARFRLGPDPERSLLVSATFIAAPDPVAWACAEREGLAFGHPFLDRELIELMRRHPASWEESGGVPKGMLRRALSDVLPTRIYARSRKVPFNAVYAHGVQRHAEELIDMCLSARHPLVADMFDTQVLADAVVEAAAGAGNAIATDRVNSSLALIAWLEGLGDRFRREAEAVVDDALWEVHTAPSV